jgi:ribonuclease G
VKLYEKEYPILEEYGVQAEIDKALRSKVWLKSGGSIVINQTEELVQQDGQTFVFVADGEQAQRREVKLGYESEGAVEILDGVTLGENVIVAGQGNLKEGSKIKEVQGGAA